MKSDFAYGFKTTVDGSVDEAEALVREALGREGFGVLTRIDIAEAFREKLGVSHKAYRILGACNPPLAHKAITAEEDIGLLLPCNVVVYEGAEEGTSVVAALDPVLQLGVSGRDDLGDLADDVRDRLQRVIDSI